MAEVRCAMESTDIKDCIHLTMGDIRRYDLSTKLRP